MLFMISGVWFGMGLSLVCLSRHWLMGFEHQAWGVATLAVFLAYSLVAIGWIVPMLWAVIRLISPSLMRGEHSR